jgi:SAM-dependent methyltransferase
VLGITPVASQIVRARRFARQQGVHVSFEQQDYTRVAVPDASFDAVWAIESVCHAPDKRLFLAEARRVLRPGGRLGIVEYFRVGRPYADADERLMNSWLSGWAIPDLATGEEFVGWTRDASFSDVQLDDIGRRVDPSLRRLSRMTRLLYPAAAALHALGIRSSVQHGNVRGARDQYRARRRGLWFEGLLTATASAEHRL